MASRYELITDDETLCTMLTQPGMVYVNTPRVPTSKFLPLCISPDHKWLLHNDKQTAHRLKCLRDKWFYYLIEE